MFGYLELLVNMHALEPTSIYPVKRCALNIYQVVFVCEVTRRNSGSGMRASKGG